jgi:catechol 2,3-dioxygenase-like lactoylglutathione lyase family enzyme
MISYEDISHVGLEVTDLGLAERFYTEALGMKLLHRDDGDFGAGRIVLQNLSGQLLFLEKVDELSARSRFCGPDEANVPDPDGPVRFKGSHLAMSVQSLEEYDEVKTTYFYDPFGNRLQLIILPSGGQRRPEGRPTR